MAASNATAPAAATPMNAGAISPRASGTASATTSAKHFSVGAGKSRSTARSRARPPLSARVGTPAAIIAAPPVPPARRLSRHLNAGEDARDGVVWRDALDLGLGLQDHPVAVRGR